MVPTSCFHCSSCQNFYINFTDNKLLGNLQEAFMESNSFSALIFRVSSFTYTLRLPSAFFLVSTPISNN